jgi:hypothetical protein
MSWNFSEAKGLDGGDAECEFDEEVVYVYVGAGARTGGTGALGLPREMTP